MAASRPLKSLVRDRSFLESRHNVSGTAYFISSDPIVAHADGDDRSTREWTLLVA